jgi:hypothetical protein
MFGTLRGDPPNGLTNFPPTGSVMSGGLCRRLRQALRRPSEEVGELKDGERFGRLADHANQSLRATAFYDAVRDTSGIQLHWSIVTSPARCFNHMLTTMC